MNRLLHSVYIMYRDREITDATLKESLNKSRFININCPPKMNLASMIILVALDCSNSIGDKNKKVYVLYKNICNFMLVLTKLYDINEFNHIVSLIDTLETSGNIIKVGKLEVDKCTKKKNLITYTKNFRRP